VAVLSAEGRTKLTTAPVEVTDDTETLVGAANLDVNAAADIASTEGGVFATAAQIPTTRDAVMTAAMANQSFFMH
jgi:hypothetical protein